jgi:3-oxoacyl-[acyl-carrier protein] reductase
MSRLEDKVAIVTGGASGLGRTFCLALAQEGAKLVIADIKDKEAEQTASKIKAKGGQAISIRADVTSEAATLAMAKETVKQFGQIDILVNNAALILGITRKPFTEIPTAEWDKMMEVNLKGAFLCSRAVFPQMKKQGKGKIINLSSETAFTGSRHMVHYVTSKGGIISFTKALAVEVGKYGIRVNAIGPGFTDSAASRSIIDDISKYDVSLTPLGRLEVPEDLTGALIFLASDDSDFITGQTLVVDGGRYMH